MNFTAVYQTVEEGGYVAWLEEMPSVQTQGETLDETKANLQEAYQLAIRFLREKSKEQFNSEAVREPFESITM